MIEKVSDWIYEMGIEDDEATKYKRNEIRINVKPVAFSMRRLDGLRDKDEMGQSC